MPESATSTTSTSAPKPSTARSSRSASTTISSSSSTRPTQPSNIATPKRWPTSPSASADLGWPRGHASATREELVEQVARVARELAEDDAHPARVALDAHDLAHAFDRLDVIHDDREVEVHLRPDRKRRLRAHEDAGLRDVGDVLLDEGVERLELFVDRDPLLAAFVVAHERYASITNDMAVRASRAARRRARRARRRGKR